MALTDKLTAIANAIRGKTGKTEPLTLDAMPGEIAGIVTGGGIEPTASYLTQREINRTIVAYPFKPKYQNELVVWNTHGENEPDSGSATPYAFFTMIVNGLPVTKQNSAGWIAGAAKTAPWADINYAYASRYSEFTLDADGNLTTPTGTWGFIGANNTCTIYEIPLPVGLGV